MAIPKTKAEWRTLNDRYMKLMRPLKMLLR